jgi:hypothetical protein
MVPWRETVIDIILTVKLRDKKLHGRQRCTRREDHVTRLF